MGLNVVGGRAVHLLDDTCPQRGRKDQRGGHLGLLAIVVGGRGDVGYVLWGIG